MPVTPDELLTTTRTVRKRLDLSRPVPMSLIRECLEVALQAPEEVDERSAVRRRRVRLVGAEGQGLLQVAFVATAPSTLHAYGEWPCDSSQGE